MNKWMNYSRQDDQGNNIYQIQHFLGEDPQTPLPPAEPTFVQSRRVSHHREGCLVQGFLSRELPVLFWKVTLLSFQVTCPSSCVTGLIISLDSWLCPPVPHYPNVSYSLCLPLSCARVFRSVMYPTYCHSPCLDPCQELSHLYFWFLASS